MISLTCTQARALAVTMTVMSVWLWYDGDIGWVITAVSAMCCPSCKQIRQRRNQGLV
ncbi:hypothetical protein SAMN05421753_111180 [Planctomicrobium piriforme]|uniref:Uncharacterized protein n=1 Tax=Planctomicrobium piriforme TaxID=1576369 RepID=A0A1I3KBX1_9PLAN|nr:hypothetical protein SAMN05421753_111180 [Planctomicrobium piriforme]